jgi:hypothetical protein
MTTSWTIGAQLSTSHSPESELSVERIASAVRDMKAILPLDLAVVGAKEIPEIFRALTGPQRPAEQVVLWYDLLSDISQMEERELVINCRGQKSHGWGGWAEAGSTITETFRFACPNNPVVRAKTLARMRELLTRYPFDGVFLDKIRFPSPANGVEEVASCFCHYCQAAASVVDLDLDSVRKVIDAKFAGAFVRHTPAGEADWLRSLLVPDSILGRFVDFRLHSITGLVSEAAAEARALGRKVALDVFSPGLAPLVGQDYPALAKVGDWIKPMTYRMAQGPAGLRLELSALVAGAARMSGLQEGDIEAWAARHIRGFTETSLSETRAKAVPLEIMTTEVADAVRLAGSTPVYFGIEMVRHAGVIDIRPQDVRDMVTVGQCAGAAGTIISWDLLHAPGENLAALRDSLR